MKSFQAILLVILNLMISSCSGRVFSPHINFRNVSEDVIYNITGKWNGYRLGGHLERFPGDGGGETFLLQNKSHLYGPVHIEWQNSKKEKIVKDFEFKKEDMPNFGKEKTGSIDFYLTQDDLIMFVTPHGSIFANEEEKKMSKKAGEYQRNFLRKRCLNGYKSPYCPK